MSEFKFRSIDLVLGLLILVVASPLLVIIAITIRLIDGKPIIFWSIRIGRHSKPFLMPKFRTMRNGAPIVASREANSHLAMITPLGSYLRKSSLDELPQLFSVLRGEMSLVGPRPALSSQVDLVAERRTRGIDSFRPGITGLAQVLGRDLISDRRKIALDLYFLRRRSVTLYLKIILSTVVAVIRRRGVSH